MISVGMHEAKTQLSRLVEAAERGEEVVITRRGEAVAKLTAVRKRGRMADIWGISRDNPAVFADDFDELPPDIAEAFGMDVEGE